MSKKPEKPEKPEAPPASAPADEHRNHGGLYVRNDDGTRKLVERTQQQPTSTTPENGGEK